MMGKLEQHSDASIKKLSKTTSDYPDATLPIADTDVLLVNQGGTWKQVKKRDLTIVKTENSVSGSFAIDYNIATQRLTLVGNTTFTEGNLPDATYSKTITLHITGNFGVVFPSSFTSFITGEYRGTASLNTVVIECFGTFRKVQISQPN